MATFSSPFWPASTASCQDINGGVGNDVIPINYNNHLAAAGAFTPRTFESSPPNRATRHIQNHNQSFSSEPSLLPATPRPMSHALGQLVSLQETGNRSSTATTTAIEKPYAQSPQQRLARQPLRIETYAKEDLDRTTNWNQDKEKVVRAPFDYVISHPGKDFRSQLVAAFDAWLQVPPASLETISKVVAMLHESSLLLDDVQDSSELRRGSPVAHSIFGVPQTINSANYMCYVALQELQKLNNPKLVIIFTEEIINLYRGQGMELFWRETLTCPTEEDYLEMVGNKTGGLFRLGIRLMQAESAAAIECTPLVNLIGLVFQIRDDLLNLSAEYTDNKGLCEDLTEGKFSFPVIHSIRSDPANFQLVNILRQRTSDEQVKRYAVSYMEQTGSFAYTRTILTALIERARDMVFDIDAGRGRTDSILRVIAKMVVE
ncbi:Geranylgeranyl pyrophosphate synthase [Hirsutella minnesotensis 3608]|uniref:Geranylgeranyl pyrophosphate synthase n=1 Tax=Hirsutella minnesotensis 3608 TaxID=1043627 RepID=A0A0F8A328_9HYPO|nr:Geranylgeranyl pyrophosphate synthase [Hirsutella minnesotensis 3608]